MLTKLVLFAACGLLFLAFELRELRIQITQTEVFVQYESLIHAFGMAHICCFNEPSVVCWSHVSQLISNTPNI